MIRTLAHVSAVFSSNHDRFVQSSSSQASRNTWPGLEASNPMILLSNYPKKAMQARFSVPDTLNILEWSTEIVITANDFSDPPSNAGRQGPHRLVQRLHSRS